MNVYSNVKQGRFQIFDVVIDYIPKWIIREDALRLSICWGIQGRFFYK